MTREEREQALEWFKNRPITMPGAKKMYDLAFEALSADGDTISRQAAIDAHYEYCNKHPDAGFPVWSLKILEDLPPTQSDLSGYSDKLWKAAYERGKAEAQPDLDEVYAHAETEAEARLHAEIVRCEDCKYAPKCYGDVLMRSRGGGYIYCPVEYCSAAERRTDGV